MQQCYTRESPEAFARDNPHLRPSDPGEEFSISSTTLGVSYRRVIVSRQLDVFAFANTSRGATDLNVASAIADAMQQKRMHGAQEKAPG